MSEVSNEVGVQTVSGNYTDRIYGITIRAVDRGYIVEVGCKTFVMIDNTELISYLTDYLNNPAELHKKYFEGELFKKPTV